MIQSLLHQIREEMPKMAAAERRVAEAVNAKPNDVIHMSMAVLAKDCRVSDPTIIRFCRRFGFEGYQDFKVNLAQNIVPRAPFHYDKITADDTVENIVRKTCENSLSAIQRALEDLVPAQIEAGAKAIHAASWLAIYATGISEVTAIDAEHKFQRLGFRCSAILGEKRQRTQAGFARPGELAMIFSQSGATRQMVELAKATREQGATVLSITAGDTPLTVVSDHVIAVTPYDHTELLTPLASRLNHHLVVNMLVTAIAVMTGNEFPDQLPALDSWLTEKL
ncbi:MurR/RpiR family transcriptional regulator [Jiella avicenniae]|uniref:MurR/RpiR family transcriptional regulator n=1 Tax=Jiella avicenniae TaxID=2907202 RepID=A0A9X1P256_9HYPH|nr:MurR/RpiR family transcriptional regulator [Jiella avicenniae]MCE7030015.1 MurR/RpiR family transcriptional regulator [Jiella avicenniae]